LTDWWSARVVKRPHLYFAGLGRILSRVLFKRELGQAELDVKLLAEPLGEVREDAPVVCLVAL
jgi:hypothetical protein